MNVNFRQTQRMIRFIYVSSLAGIIFMSAIALQTSAHAIELRRAYETASQN